MRHSKYYNLRLPERTRERNDPADIDDITHDLESLDGILKAQAEEDTRLEQQKLSEAAHNRHCVATPIDHPDDSVTDAKLGERSIGGVTGLLSELLAAVGNALKAATGAASWDMPPATTLLAAQEHAQSTANPHTVTKAQVGLAQADDTPDTQKPVSAAQAAAIAQLRAAVLTRDNTEVYTPTEAYNPATKKYIDDQMGAAGSGDMMKAVYDQNNSGVVDNAKRVNGLTVLTAVPAGAAFTDTVYTHPATHPAAMITGLPSALPANGGTADVARSIDGGGY